MHRKQSHIWQLSTWCESPDALLAHQSTKTLQGTDCIETASPRCASFDVAPVDTILWRACRKCRICRVFRRCASFDVASSRAYCDTPCHRRRSSTAARQCASSGEFSAAPAGQTLRRTNHTYEASLPCVSFGAPSGDWTFETLSHTNRTCTAFRRCAFVDALSSWTYRAPYHIPRTRTLASSCHRCDLVHALSDGKTRQRLCHTLHTRTVSHRCVFVDVFSSRMAAWTPFRKCHTCGASAVFSCSSFHKWRQVQAESAAECVQPGDVLHDKLRGSPTLRVHSLPLPHTRHLLAVPGQPHHFHNRVNPQRQSHQRVVVEQLAFSSAFSPDLRTFEVHLHFPQCSPLWWDRPVHCPAPRIIPPRLHLPWTKTFSDFHLPWKTETGKMHFSMKLSSIYLNTLCRQWIEF